MDCVLKVENLEYQDILKNVTFTLEKGKFYALTGSNGSGKTTLVMSILGLIKYAGSIIVMNNYACQENMKSIIQNIGVMADFRSLEETVNSALSYPLVNIGYDESTIQSMVYDLANKLKLNDLLLKNVDALNISERKLVLFASSIIHNPSLIIIDDTLDDIDYSYKKRIIDYLKKLKNTTTLFVTNSSEDYLLCDEVLIMDNGKIVEKIKKEDFALNEKKFIKYNMKLPFSIDLSNKLKFYNIIDHTHYDIDEMVDSIWK